MYEMKVWRVLIKWHVKTSRILVRAIAACVSQYIWVNDQACSVKIAGYWPTSFFACLWTETPRRSPGP